jgi:hypothetical protein
MRRRHGIPALVALLLTATAGAAAAKPEPKCTIMKGDEKACQAEATAKCSGKERYDETEKCVWDIAVKYEKCGTPEMKKDSEEAREIVSICRNSSFGETHSHHLDSENATNLAAWIERANKVDAAGTRFAELHKKWSVCTGDGDYRWGWAPDECEDAPKQYASSFAEEVAEMIERRQGYLKDGWESLKSGDDDDYSAARNAYEEAKKIADHFLAINAKLPAKLRHGVKELEALRAEGKKLEAAYDKKTAGDIAARGCPPGKKLTGKHLKTLNGRIGKDDVKRRIIKQSEGPNRWRDGLITKEGVPVIVCSERIEEGKKSCDAAKFTVWREKAPGGPWTSWDVSVGGFWKINCKKMK